MPRYPLPRHFMACRGGGYTQRGQRGVDQIVEQLDVRFAGHQKGKSFELEVRLRNMRSCRRSWTLIDEREMSQSAREACCECNDMTGLAVDAAGE